MPSTSDIMNKLRSSKKGKYFREGEESRAYQFLNKNEEIQEKKPRSPDLKSGSGTKSGSPDLKSGSGTKSGSPDLKSGSGTKSGSPDLKSGSGTKSGSPDLKSGSGTKSGSDDLKSGSGTESGSDDLKSGSSTESGSDDLKSGSGTESGSDTNPKLVAFLKAVVEGKLSLREVKVYSCLILERQPEVKISGNELAKKTQISRGTITQIVKSLIQKGFLEKQPSEDSMNVYKLT